MRFNSTALADAYLIEMEPIADDRGSFARAWCEREFRDHGLNPRIAQVNSASSRRRGTLRGLHYQIGEHQEAKLIRCVRGAVYDVIIDLRPSSPTHLQWMGVELGGSAEGHMRMLYVPEGFAHGYQTLTDEAEMVYQVSAFYAPGAERGIRWNDPLFQIEWPIGENLLISPKDQSWPDYAIEPLRHKVKS